MHKETSLSEVFNNKVREFADYDNQRMIPHVADGLKTSLRKVMRTIIKHPGKHKVANLGSLASAYTNYNHGEDSIIDTVVTLARNYPGTNNVPLLEALGQFGSRLKHDASSPRYISTKIHENFRRLFDERDFEVVTPQFDEGDEIEPKFYLPLLPTILMNRSEGIGVGFRSDILPHSFESVKQATLEALDGGKVKTPLVPFLKDWKGKVKMNGRQTIFYGVIEKVNSNTFRVTEAPPSTQLLDYKAHLNKLIDDKVINDYDNNSGEKGWDIEIKCPRAFLQLPEDKLLEKMGLVERTTQVLTAWDFQGNIRRFQSTEELVEYWVENRLPFFEARRLNELKIHEEQMAWMDVKARFIVWWRDKGNEVVKTTPRASLLGALDIGVAVEEETLARLLRLPLSSLTLDEVQKMEEEAKKLRAEVERLKVITPRQMMTEEIISL